MEPSTEKQILEELRKVTKYVDFQRKLSKWALIFLVVILPLLIAAMVVTERYKKQRSKCGPEDETSLEWSDVSKDEENGKLNEALDKAKRLIAMSPNDSHGYQRQGYIYLYMDKQNEALKSFEKAYELFPSESAQKLLDAMNRKLDRKKEPEKANFSDGGT